MFTKVYKTNYPPKLKPMMVFDGKCGFCRYWVVKWMKITKSAVDYKPYQEVANNFEDISENHFREAVRYIDIDGNILSGPDAAYITYYHQQSKWKFLHLWYLEKRWFQRLSDTAYQWVADNRNFMSKVSIQLFGKNPANPKGYWKIYLLFFIILLASLVYFLLANI